MTLRDLRDGEFFRFANDPDADGIASSAVFYARGGGWYDVARRDPESGLYARLGQLGGPWSAPDAAVVRVDAEGARIAAPAA